MTYVMFIRMTKLLQKYVISDISSTYGERTKELNLADFNHLFLLSPNYHTDQIPQGNKKGSVVNKLLFFQFL